MVYASYKNILLCMLLIVSHFYAMDNDGMLTIKTVNQLKQFEGAVVAYTVPEQRRFMFPGYRLPDSSVNYGYMEYVSGYSLCQLESIHWIADKQFLHDKRKIKEASISMRRVTPQEATNILNEMRGDKVAFAPIYTKKKNEMLLLLESIAQQEK